VKRIRERHRRPIPHRKYHDSDPTHRVMEVAG
jgi:hypothetical protein